MTAPPADAELYLLRHGETIWNRQRRVQGHKDSPLTLNGIRQAERFGRRLAVLLEAPGDWRIVASPLGRAWQTAVIVAETLGWPADTITTDERLKEMAWGRWDGLTAEEIEAQDALLWQARIDDRWTRPPPGGGETQSDLLVRARSWLAAIEPGARLVVVAHGALGRAVRTAYLGLEPEAMLELDQPQDAFFRLRHGSIERLDVAPG